MDQKTYLDLISSKRRDIMAKRHKLYLDTDGAYSLGPVEFAGGEWADGLEVDTGTFPSVTITIPGAFLRDLARRARENRSGKAVVGGTRSGGGITATVCRDLDT